jgi:AhpD family alkylhydroperoxidase
MGQMVKGVDPANNEALAEIERKTGPNNFYRVLAQKPDVMASYPAVYRSIMGSGSIDRRLKEMLYLAVSTVNECCYCTEAHRKGALYSPASAYPPDVSTGPEIWVNFSERTTACDSNTSAMT